MLERTAAFHADAVIASSRFKADVLRARIHPAKVHLLPWVVTPTPVASVATRRGLAILGFESGAMKPEAARWLAKEFLPELRRQGALAPCVLLSDRWPENLDDTAAGPEVGREVLESLALGIPCVCPPDVAHGMGLPPTVHDQATPSRPDS